MAYLDSPPRYMEKLVTKDYLDIGMAHLEVGNEEEIDYEKILDEFVIAGIEAAILNEPEIVNKIGGPVELVDSQYVLTVVYSKLDELRILIERRELKPSDNTAELTPYKNLCAYWDELYKYLCSRRATESGSSGSDNSLIAFDQRNQRKVNDNYDYAKEVKKYDTTEHPVIPNPPGSTNIQESYMSQMSAFPQLWRWSGEGQSSKGRSKKQYFKAIQRGNESIRLGDVVLFLSAGQSDRPYIGRIEAMWEKDGLMTVKGNWFYHPEETVGCPQNLKYEGALFESPHTDENDVQTIMCKCEVLPLENYIQALRNDPRKYLAINAPNNSLYYLAGYYNPSTQKLTMQPGIPLRETE